MNNLKKKNVSKQFLDNYSDKTDSDNEDGFIINNNESNNNDKIPVLSVKKEEKENDGEYNNNLFESKNNTKIRRKYLKRMNSSKKCGCLGKIVVNKYLDDMKHVMIREWQNHSVHFNEDVNK